MGLDASVMCNCYRDGKAKPCPFPDLYYVDDDGFPAVRLDMNDAYNEEKSDEFDAWLASCCEHPYMDQSSVYLADWRGYHAFVDALKQGGEGLFSALLAALPDENNGLIPASIARQCLHELELFKQQSGVIKTFLVNTVTGSIISSRTGSESGMFSWDGRTGMRAGFDENGFFIVDAWELNREMFRAVRMSQRQLESDELGQPDRFEYTDLDTGQQFVCGTPVRIFVKSDFGTKQEYPQQMHIEKRSVDVDYFQYILEPLSHILQVSVQTGNPVRWS